jgi:hypothetical protein
VYVGATLPSRCGSQSRAPATEGGRGESNLVQAKNFSGALGSGVRTTAEAGAHSRSGGLLANICMFAKAGVSFSVSPGLGWSVGTMERTTVEGAGSGGRTSTGVEGYARSAGFSPNTYLGRDAALRRPRRRAQRQATQSPRFPGAPAIAEFRPLNAGGGVAAQRPYLQSEGFAWDERESNQVQAIAFFFAGAGSGARTSTGTGGYARSAGLLPNRYMRCLRAERVKHWVSRECPGFRVDPCRDPGSASVSGARVGVPPTLPVPIRFPSFVSEEDGGTPVLGDRDGRARPIMLPPRERVVPRSTAGFHADA